MPDPIRIRARSKGEYIEALVLAPHPMETGLRKDEHGRLIPAHFITEMVVEVAGRTVLRARMGNAMSADPMVTFRFRGARAGEPIRVTWLDNRGQKRSDETLIS